MIDILPAAASAATRQMSTEPAAVPVLRTTRMKPSGRLAVLIWHLAGQHTRIQLYRAIAGSLPRLWGGGPSTSVVLRDFASQYTRGVAVDYFTGGRSDLPSGALKNIKPTGMTYTKAQQILLDPGRWPTDVVRWATERLSQRLAGQPLIADVANSLDWLGPAC